ncbi:MAG: hypothetical protein ACRDSZ_24740 [Pseudonocardiaceae bacterium]
MPGDWVPARAASGAAASSRTASSRAAQSNDDDLTDERTRTVKWLHALLRDLLLVVRNGI